MADDIEEAPEDDGEDAEGEGAKKKKLAGKKIVLFAGLPALLLILGGAAGFMLLGGKKDAHGAAEAHVEDGGRGGEHAQTAASEVVFYELPDVLVNIRSEDGRPSFIKLKLTLEVDSEEVAHAIEPAMPRIMDRFNGFLRELRVEDLSGSAASYRLRMELLRRVNMAVAPVRIRAVLIEEMLIQ